MTTKPMTPEELAHYVKERAILVAFNIQASGLPSDAVTALAMIQVALGGLHILGRSHADVRGYVDQLLRRFESATPEVIAGLSIDAALADAKAHATKPPTGGASVAQNYDANGSVVP